MEKYLIRPFNGSFPVTQTWGINEQDYIQFGLKGHNGVDYGLPDSTPVIAPHGGKIIEVANDPSGYGLYVKIENDIEGSILAHLKRQDVNVGDIVNQGQQIGLSGNTGNSTGPHLHWGYYRKPRNKGDGYSGTINPWPYLKENNQDENSDIVVEGLRKKVESLERQIVELNKSYEDRLAQERQAANQRLQDIKKDILLIINRI